MKNVATLIVLLYLASTPAAQPAITPAAQPAITPAAQPAIIPAAQPAIIPAAQHAVTLAAQPTYDGARPGNVIGTGHSLPRSDQAGNIDGKTTHSELAPNLPAPASGDDLQSLLLDARSALQGGRTGEAQEALERAESRALDRSIPAGTERAPASDPLVAGISGALQALGAGDTAGTVKRIDGVLPLAAQADIPE